MKNHDLTIRHKMLSFGNTLCAAQRSARPKSSYPFYEKLCTYVSPRVSVPTRLLIALPPLDFQNFLRPCETSHVVAYFATFSFLLKIIPLFDIDCRNKNPFLYWFYAPLRRKFKICVLKYRKISCHSGKAEIKNSF